MKTLFPGAKPCHVLALSPLVGFILFCSLLSEGQRFNFSSEGNFIYLLPLYFYSSGELNEVMLMECPV